MLCAPSQAGACDAHDPSHNDNFTKGDTHFKGMTEGPDAWQQRGVRTRDANSELPLYLQPS